MSRHLLPIFTFIAAVGIYMSCTTMRLPNETYYPYKYQNSVDLTRDSLTITLDNPLRCPLRQKLTSKNSTLDNAFQEIGTVTLQPVSDATITLPNRDYGRVRIGSKGHLGSLAKEVNKEKLSLPFPQGNQYKITQPYNGSFSHNTEYARYSLDLDLQIGDTVTASADGYVVGMVEQYKKHGESEQWKRYANHITLYHPSSGLFTEYSHLKHQGSFVELGDKVSKSEPIALCGFTGWATAAHLDFKALVPVEDGLTTTKVIFEEGYVGEELAKHDVVEK
jgi:murein DD-endopeptidase MepM/ murein hydrolase activator NlpD